MHDRNTLIIDTNDLTKTFKGVNALQSLDLKVPKNSFFGRILHCTRPSRSAVVW